MKYSGFRHDVKRHVLTFSTSGQRQVTTCCTCAVKSRKKCHVSGCSHRAGDVCCFRCLINRSKPTNDWWQTLHESFSKYHHGLTDQSRFMDQPYNIVDWQILFTWLWRWLPLRLSKRQSPTTVSFRTTLTQTITQYELLIFLGSNHLLSEKWKWDVFVSSPKLESSRNVTAKVISKSH